MRLVRVVLFVALTAFTGSVALADDAKPADPKPEVTDAKPEVAKKKVPYRVVKILPETEQVLLYDKIHGTHVVAESGDALDGYTIDDIDDDEVTLVADDGSSVILTAPPPPHQKKAKKAKAQPLDPYADPGEPVPLPALAESAAKPAPQAASDATTSVPVDPYAEPAPPAAAGEGGVRVAGAPSEPAPAPPAPIIDSGAPELQDPYGGDPGIRAFAEAVGATPAPAAHAPALDPLPAAKPAKVKAKAKPAPAPDAAAALAAAATGDATVEVPAAAPAPGAIVVARADLDAALANFSKLAASFRATFTPEGLRMDAINDGTLLAKAGLHKGDVVTAVDGRPLRSLDDAANLYARSSTVKSATVQVLRSGKPTTLRVAIQ